MKRLIAVIAACALVLCMTGCGSRPSSEMSEEAQATDGRFLSDYPGCYVVTDTETGVQYLFAKGSGGYAGYGGLTALLNPDGTPVVADGYDDGE